MLHASPRMCRTERPVCVVASGRGWLENILFDSMKHNKKQHKNKSVPQILVQRPPYVRPSLRGAPSTTPTTLAKAEPQGTLQQVGREADMAWAGVKRIMSLLNVENKHVYYNASNINVTQVGSILDLTSLISQGVGGTQRIGDSLKILNVRIKATFAVNSSATVLQSTTCVLGHSKDGVPAVADVFAVVSSSTSGLAFPADTYAQADKWTRSDSFTVYNTEPVRQINYNQKFGHDVLYTNASTTSASGNVWFGYISNEPTNYPTMNIAVDIEFVDN